MVNSEFYYLVFRNTHFLFYSEPQLECYDKELDEMFLSGKDMSPAEMM